MVVKMSMLVSWVVTPCGLTDTNVSENYTASIFSPEEGHGMFLRNAGIYLRVHTALQPRITTSTIF
jgi:hypothetical protein